MTSWPLQNEVTVPAMPSAPYWARRHVADVLEKWGCEELSDSVLLVVSELVTNGLKATGGLDDEQAALYGETPRSVPYSELVKAGYVRLRLSSDRARVMVEVWDRGNEPLELRLPGLEDEGGRGLFLVEAICEQWGWYAAEHGGKVVWGQLSTS